MLNDARQPVKFFPDSFPFSPFPLFPVISLTHAGPLPPPLITFPPILVLKTKNQKPFQPMDNRCTVCTHPSLAEIDQALLQGLPLRPLGAQYGLSSSALRRIFLFSPVQGIWYDYVTRSTPCLSISPPNTPRFRPAIWVS